MNKRKKKSWIRFCKQCGGYVKEDEDMFSHFFKHFTPEPSWMTNVETYPDLRKDWPPYKSNDWIPTAPGFHTVYEPNNGDD